jgi:hypothetical protein
VKSPYLKRLWLMGRKTELDVDWMGERQKVISVGAIYDTCNRAIIVIRH